MIKILIVDDSLSWRNFHKNALGEIFIEINCDDYIIDTASCAKEGYDLIMQNNDIPYNLIISDLQMEEDFQPKYAGEWFVEQIKTFKSYSSANVIISSGCYNIKQTAENLSADYIPKRIAVTDINAYKSKIISYLK